MPPPHTRHNPVCMASLNILVLEPSYVRARSWEPARCICLWPHISHWNHLHKHLWQRSKQMDQMLMGPWFCASLLLGVLFAVMELHSVCSHSHFHLVPALRSLQEVHISGTLLDGCICNKRCSLTFWIWSCCYMTIIHKMPMHLPRKDSHYDDGANTIARFALLLVSVWSGLYCHK